MYNLNKIIFLSLIFFSTTIFSTTAGAQSLTLDQVLQRVIDHYPSVKRAAIQVEKAKQEIIKVNSLLGWQLSAQGGISQNVSVFGISSSTLNASGIYSRLLETGETLSIDAAINHDNADTVFSPTIPNPNTILNVNLNFRKPLQKGKNNSVFEEGQYNAISGVTIVQAEKARLYDQLASNVIELYLSAGITQARINNIHAAVKRTKRLQKFIQKRENLGIAEEKDTLQVNAQLISQKAELSGLHIVWEKQRLSLNRLMGASIHEKLKPVLNLAHDYSMDKVYENAKYYSPEIKAVDARIKLADSAIRISRDANEDQLDLVLYIGARNQSATTGSTESDIVGGARLEFLQQQDQSGQSAELYQAQLNRSAAIEDKRQVVEDLQYDIASLMAEIKAAKQAVSDYKKSVHSEQLKLNEAEQRYKTGRADIDQIILFENQLSIARLSYELQNIELSRRLLNIQLKQGLIWQNIQIQDLTEIIRREAS